MPRYAAIDIGSNSIRMEAVEVNHLSGSQPTWRILASQREVTRLGEGVFRSGRITGDALQETCGVLEQMAEECRRVNVAGVRAVATSAVREADNQREFLERASRAAGIPVEVISGQEEASLIHLGVQSRWPNPGKRVLIVDVGGGSAEIILSEGGRMAAAFTKPLGAVRLTETFLEHDPPSAREIHRLERYIEEKIRPAVDRIRTGPLDRAIATSATAAALACALHRLPRPRRCEADRRRLKTSQLRKFYQKATAKDLAARRQITGIGPRRAEIILAGAAVLLRVMLDFRLPSLYYCAAGLRDGVIADLAARCVARKLSRLDRDRRRVVEEMARRCGVSLPHARNVAGLACALFEQLEPLHGLAPGFGRMLEAAAYLHDVGHSVSGTGHHKHSFYLVANADLPGFAERERLLIANLCRYHGKSAPKPGHEGFQMLNPDDRHAVMLLMPLLRIADSLDRSHEQRVQRVQCHLRNGCLTLQLLARQDTNLEEWALERLQDVFQGFYDRQLRVVRAR